MSVTGYAATGDAYWGFTEGPCFYCDTPLTDPAVRWIGATGVITLHPRCVLDLFVRLARDVHETECPAHYARLRALVRR